MYGEINLNLKYLINIAFTRAIDMKITERKKQLNRVTFGQFGYSFEILYIQIILKKFGRAMQLL